MDARQFEEDLHLIAHGWTFWPQGTSDEQKASIILRYMQGEDFPLLPPGYQEEPIITEGKLKG